MATKVRLDALLAQRGLFETRTRAAASVLAGEVRIGSHGMRATKPGALVAADVELSVDDVPRFVSRGGIKLANALASSGVEVAGRRCLDVGASTGGFTDCLLAAGAAAVVALDVAYGELSWKLRGDSRVSVLERFNARELAPGVLPYAPEVIVADLAFISLRTVLRPILSCAAPRFDGYGRLAGAMLIPHPPHDEKPQLPHVETPAPIPPPQFPQATSYLRARCARWSAI